MSYTNLLYHVVFATKERFPHLTSEFKLRFHEYLGGTVRGLGGIALEIGGIEDHVHLLIKLKPTLNLSDFLRDLKANSSRWANQTFQINFAWQRRYGAFTVSESQVEKVRNYIKNQEMHHKKFNFREEFELLLKAHRVEFDDGL